MYPRSGFSSRGNMRTYPRSGFSFRGNIRQNHPSGKPPFCQPPNIHFLAGLSPKVVFNVCVCVFPGPFFCGLSAVSYYCFQGPDSGEPVQRVFSKNRPEARPQVTSQLRLFPLHVQHASSLRDWHDWTTGGSYDGNDWRKYCAVPRTHPLRPCV